MESDPYPQAVSRRGSAAATARVRRAVSGLAADTEVSSLGWTIREVRNGAVLRESSDSLVFLPG
ncbi:hypothetical protein GCM10014715_42730 [Streptomyces spiralis]|uniref:Uncharacterized protein n=1 Tax=Streptomyces spiralis TaxID=66376 RepID=A0A919DV41_9ACTN|nr:hypothetical protein GCM10014715_42730 [Streptomyces spiralis]